MAAIKKSSALCQPYDDTNEEFEMSVPACLNKRNGEGDIFPPRQEATRNAE